MKILTTNMLSLKMKTPHFGFNTPRNKMHKNILQLFGRDDLFIDYCKLRNCHGLVLTIDSANGEWPDFVMHIIKHNPKCIGYHYTPGNEIFLIFTHMKYMEEMRCELVAVDQDEYGYRYPGTSAVSITAVFPSGVTVEY